LDKFPEGYIFELDNKEFTDLRWKISTTNLSKTRVLPKAFTKLCKALHNSDYVNKKVM